MSLIRLSYDKNSFLWFDLKFSSIIKSNIFSKFFTHKIERDFYDTIIGRYDINMTHITKIMSYREFSH